MESNRARYSFLQKPTLLWLVWFSVHVATALLLIFVTIPLRYGYRYTDIGIDFGLPEWVGLHANFDGVHYVTIAREGYGLLQQAFFPLYPMALRYVSIVFAGNMLLAGFVMSVGMSLCAIVVWYRVFLLLTQSTRDASRAIIALLLFPGAFFLVSLYTESLFLLLLGLYVWGILTKRLRLVGVVGVLLGLTRLAGSLVVLIPLSMVAVSLINTRKIYWKKIIAGITPLIGLGMYMVYSKINFGDSLAFFHIQEQFNNGRSTSIILLPQVVWRYINIFLKARVDIVYFVAVVELTVFMIVFVLLVWLLYREIAKVRGVREVKERSAVVLGLILFSIANLLLPTLTGTLSSIPRYSLVGVAVYLAISSLPRPFRTALVSLSFLLQTILFMLFARGWFVS